MDKINIVSSQVVQTTGETVNSITCLLADNFCLQVKKGPVFFLIPIVFTFPPPLKLRPMAG